MEAWLLDAGAKLDRVQVQGQGCLRGVFAVSPVKEGEHIFSIPLSCLITAEMGKATDVGKILLESEASFKDPQHVFLSVYMLMDRAQGEAAQFKHYYDSLPVAYDEIPMCWSANELQWLEGSPVRAQAKLLKDSIESDYNQILEIAPEFGKAVKRGMQDWKWARLSVCSRCFGIAIDGVETMVQVPLGDMTNHKRPPETRWEYTDSTQHLAFTALQDFELGAQIHGTYGRKCNSRFFCSYGMVKCPVMQSHTTTYKDHITCTVLFFGIVLYDFIV